MCYLILIKGGFVQHHNQYNNKGHIMLPFIPSGASVGLRILKTLYKGKSNIGKGSAFLADKAGKAGLTRTSKAITGASKKAHEGSRYMGKKIRKYPKTASAIGGAALWDFLPGKDND